ncbi:hypothetical protein CCACVL1_00445 [Corchorus capsularis]|uniref:Uncharacterized protein n=1 Tax=Corchorus capsularis TaxID=210143 RepID=A0A1R3KWU8_COCAP|nr:hypothetical protein CCACVL1_00445 [Corchorus capsularis]
MELRSLFMVDQMEREKINSMPPFPKFTTRSSKFR